MTATQPGQSSRAEFAVIALALAAALVWMTSLGQLGDYPYDGGPPIDALIDGDLDEFFSLQPLMGSFSLLLRAPAAALAGGDELRRYQAGSLVCLLVAGAVALLIEREMARRGRPLWLRLGIVALCVLNPMVEDALQYGHPEEILGAALCVGAVLAAMRGRPIWAALLLALAVTTKQWAVLAVAPVAIALPRVHRRGALIALAVAALLTVPLLVANWDRFSQVSRQISSPGTEVRATSLYAPFVAVEHRRVYDGVEYISYRRLTWPKWAGRASRFAIVVVGFAIAALYAFRRRDEDDPTDVLALLALVLLLRCMLDTLNNGYYHLPFLFALAAWEGLKRDGLPIATLLATLAAWLIWGRLVFTGEDPRLLTAFYLAWTVPMAIYLALVLFAPGRAGRLGDRLGLNRPLREAASNPPA